MVLFLLLILFLMAKKKKHNRKLNFQEFVNSLKRENTPRIIDTKINTQRNFRRL